MKLMSILLSALILSSSALMADIKTGQKVYLKTLKSKFGIDGGKFAAQHTVAEWEDLFSNEANGFIKEYSEKYPSAAPVLQNPDMKDKLQDIGDFAKEYGSDSGNVPSCG